MCVCVCVCVGAEGSAVGAGYESGILVFKLSKVGQFQVMTRRRVRPQEWALKDRWKVLGVERLWRPGMDIVHGDTQATPLELGDYAIPKSDAWVRAEERGRASDGISLIHLHSFIWKYSPLICLPSQATKQFRSLSLT